MIHLSRLSQLGVAEVIDRLIAAGLDSIPGGGAEILVDRVRRLLHCYGKATADEWLDVMRHAHHRGLRTTATMMYGTVETLEERIEHMMRLRDLQDETGGFTAFITWSFQPEHTELGGIEATGVDYLRTLALARIVLDNFDNLQASWVTQGGKVGQLSLAYGANDMGSVMIEENVVRAAGAAYCMDEIEIVRNVEDAGFVPKRRNMHYDVLGDPIFRERAVPRMLSLATARADGAGGRSARRASPIPPAAVPAKRRDSKCRSIARRGCCRFRSRRFAMHGCGPIAGASSRSATRAPATSPPSDEIDLGDVAVLPGLVNAHTHLELSWMRGRIPETDDFSGWIRRIIELKNEARAAGRGSRGRDRRSDSRGACVRHGPRRRHHEHARDVATAERARHGGRGVPRASRLSAAKMPRASCKRRRARLQSEPASDLVRHTLAPHAPYSVSPALFGLIRTALQHDPFARSSVHLGESAAEIEFLEVRNGPVPTGLERMGKWDRVVGAPAMRSGRVSRSDGLSRRPRARRARRAVRAKPS